MLGNHGGALRRAAILLATGALTTGWAVPALAHSDDPQVLLLEARLKAQEQLIQELTLRLDTLEGRSPPAPVQQVAAAPVPATAATPVQALPAADLIFPTAKLRGRLHVDAWAVKDGVSGTELRRARIGAEGKLAPGWSYVVEVDFAGNTVALQDAYADFANSANSLVRLGYHKVPFSFDDQTSDNYNLFLEHPVGIDPFVPGRGVGIAYLTHGEHWFGHVGLFGEAENDARDGQVDENVTIAGRFVWTPVRTGSDLLALGVSGYRTEIRKPTMLRLRERPERHLADYALDTGLFAAASTTAVGLEAVAQHGPVGFSAEGAWSSSDASVGDLSYGGYAVEAWWTLTGESRGYKQLGGVFDRLVPARPLSEHGPGAWQIALRYSMLDLGSPALDAGRLDVGTAALIWYMESRARLMMNLNYSSAARPGLPSLDQLGLGVRLQVDF